MRLRDELHAGHVKGAFNVTLEELARYLADLPRDRETVAYCRCPYCALSYEAVEELRRQGLRARRLDAGHPEWKAAHLPVARATR